MKNKTRWMGDVIVAVVTVAAMVTISILFDAWRFIVFGTFITTCVLGLYWLIVSAVADGVRRGRQ
jgi:hypothetical protein